jgi:alpha-amylase
LNYGWLVGLADLNTGKESVRARIADYLTDLLGIGFSGFRIDAAKHVQPDDLAAILGVFKSNLGGVIPQDWQTYLEVIIGGEKELLECEEQYYDYALYFNSAMAAAGLSDADIEKVKIWQSDYPKEFPVCGYWPLPSSRFAAQNDCADDQNPGSSSRDMGDKGSVLLKDKNVALHRSFEQQLFTRTDGNWSTRVVLSSYTFMSNGAQGIPDGLSDCSRCAGPQCSGCKSVPFTPAFDADACGYTVGNATAAWAEGVYTRVHRDRSIILAMRQWLGLPTNVTNAEIGLPPNCQ